MNLQRHAATLAAGILVSAAAPTIYAQSARIAVVDLQRAISETEDGRREIRRIKRIGKRRQAEITEAQEALKQAQERLKLLPEDQRAPALEKLQQDYAELQQKYLKYQRELAELEQRATQPIVERMEQILRRMGQSEGYTLIVDRAHGGVVWVPSNLDLTDQLIQRYNAEAPGAGGGGSTKSRRRRRRPNAD